MDLIYAVGGGLGHLRRAQAVARALALQADFVLVTASRHAGLPWVAPAGRIEAVPQRLEGRPAALRAWLRGLLARLHPARIVVDAFPGGVMGEWCDLELPAGTVIEHVARLLAWERYRRAVPGRLPAYDTVWLAEALHTDHHAALRLATRRCAPLELAPPEQPPSPLPPAGAPPLWLVVHSQPVHEVLELIAYAFETARIEGVSPRLVVATLCELPPHIACERAPRQPASALFPAAARIFSAAGFNLLRELAPYRSRHRVMPFPRDFDDQFERARRWRAGAL